MKRLVLFCLVFSLVPLSGCGQIAKDSWKFTKRQYQTYLNVPAELDYDDDGSCEIYEVALGEAMLDVDGALLKLIRAMENSDRGPDQAWAASMMQRFPWLSGVALTDQTGTAMARFPEEFAKEFSVTPLLEPDPKQPRSALRAYVQTGAMGPEIYVAAPVYVGEEFRGLVVAFFDPRALMSLSTDPGNVMLASPYGVVWPGRFSAESTPVGQNDWADVLTRKSCGTVGSGDGKFYWTTRYVGNMPLVYAFPVSAAKAPDKKAEKKPAESAAHEGESPSAPSASEAPKEVSSSSLQE